MKKIGDLLKKTREEQGLSLEQVALKTKIHIQKLTAIEEGLQDNLPAKVFTVGLVKSYARLLKIAPDIIDQLCIETFDFHPEVIEVAHLPNNNEPTETQPMGRFQISKALSIFLSISISIGLIFIIYLVVNKMNSYSSEEEPSTTKYVDPLSTENVALHENANEKKIDEPKSKMVEPETKKKSTETPLTNAQDKDSDDTKNIPLEEKVPNNNNAPESKSISPNDSPDSKINTSTSSVSENEIQSPHENSVKTESLQKTDPNSVAIETRSQVIHSDNKFSIKSLEPVRVEIIWSDGYVQVMLLKSNETKTLVFSSPILVKINNGGAVKVSFNDQAYKVPGQLNQPIELKYP